MTVTYSVSVYSCFQAAETVVAERVVFCNTSIQPAGLPDVAIVVTVAAVAVFQLLGKKVITGV